jgi:hypothetical protein
MKIYLDDLRTPQDTTFTIVRSYDEFINLIKSINFSDIEMITLDHDLGDTAIQEYKNTKVNYTIDYNNIKEYTGMDCAKWLVNYVIDNNYELPLCYTHSANPVGSANIMGYINNYLKNIRKPQTCIRVKFELKKSGN